LLTTTGTPAAGAQVSAAVDRPLPAAIPPGAATALFVYGHCWHPESGVDRLEIVVDGSPHAPAAFAMPRPDVQAAAGSADPRGLSLRSGFWGTVRVAARPGPGALPVHLAGRLADGRAFMAPLADIAIVAPEEDARLEPRPEHQDAGLIAVCMATFEPDPALFRAQVDSLRAQTDRCWVCVISDDCSSAEHLAGIREIVGGDPRFAISPSPARLGFYRNFERALSLAPAAASLVALCDQDDRWHREKLEVLRAALGQAQLVYSDQRLVDAEGRVLRETLWKGRTNNHTDLASLVVANTITGAAMLLRRETADRSLPFPDSPGFQFHDHWLALVALASGDVAYVDFPLYDYVQHRGAIFGDVSSGPRVARLRRPRIDRAALRDPLVTWRGAYFYGYLAREVQVQAALARCGPVLTAAKRRTLERFVAAARSPAALAWLALRPARELLGRNETLGSENALVRGILWRWLAGLAQRLPLSPARRAAGDASLPPRGSFNQKRLRRWRARV
jgi:glycosyltransferase involved in cell wall biosynthesis